MTGYGEAHYQSDAINISLELRALNNRYLKVSLRANEPYHLLEPEFEKVIRRSVRRGTIQVHLRCQRQFAAQDFQINAAALGAYVEQLRTLSGDLGLAGREDVLLAQALALPGVVAEPGSGTLNLEQDWPILERVLGQALERLQAMRQDEGRAMAQELLLLRDALGRELDAIRALAPQVVVAYRDRLLERVRGLLAELEVRIDRNDLIKEVHEPESAGRKLEFLTQEMFREANTIGSKASDVGISRHVVEIKGTLEKVRELVQNVE